MRNTILSSVIAGAFLMISCGQPANPVAEKKAEIKALKEQQSDLATKIQKAEADLARIDSSSEKTKEKTKLVSFHSVTPGTFNHFIELQGKIDALNIAN